MRRISTKLGRYLCRLRRCALGNLWRRVGGLSRQADPVDCAYRAGQHGRYCVALYRARTRALGQPVVVENKSGAGGTIGTADLARAAPDGYTIGFASQSTLVFDQGIYPKPGYDSVKDFASIALLGRVSNVMVVHPSSAASTPADIIAAAKSKPGTVTLCF